MKPLSLSELFTGHFKDIQGILLRFCQNSFQLIFPRLNWRRISIRLWMGSDVSQSINKMNFQLDINEFNLRPAEDLFQSMLRDSQRPQQNKKQTLCSTGPSLLCYGDEDIIQGDDHGIFRQDDCSSIVMLQQESEREEALQMQPQPVIAGNNPVEPESLDYGQEEQATSEKKKKNSNAIKKLGRIILDNEEDFACPDNIGLEAMKAQLRQRSKVGRVEQNKRDKFNTHHLKALVSSGDPRLDSFNLRTLRKTLSKWLRRNVMESHQISPQNKLIYLNTLKCSVLRCCSKKLVTRLEMPEV